MIMYNTIKFMYPLANDEDFKLRDDGDGPYIHYWNAAKLGPEPTPEQIVIARLPAQAAWNKQQNNVLILQQISALESRQHRAVREALLTGDKSRIQELENQIAALRAKLV